MKFEIIAKTVLVKLLANTIAKGLNFLFRYWNFFRNSGFEDSLFLSNLNDKETPFAFAVAIRFQFPDSQRNVAGGI